MGKRRSTGNGDVQADGAKSCCCDANSVQNIIDSLMPAIEKCVSAKYESLVAQLTAEIAELKNVVRTLLPNQQRSYASVAQNADNHRTSAANLSIQPNQAIQGAQQIKRINIEGQRAVKGSKCGDCKIATVPVKKRMSVFVGRLTKETSAEELTDHLKDIGVPGADCRKLVNKSGRQFNTSAFQVFYDCEYEDRIYSTDNWPNDCIVREWFFMGGSKSTEMSENRSTTAKEKSLGGKLSGESAAEVVSGGQDHNP